MRYVLLVFDDGSGPTPSTLEDVAGVQVSAPVRPGWAAVTLRGDGEAVTMDPSGLPALERLVGLHVVECRDIDHAVALGGRIARQGVVEIRPVADHGR